MLDWISARVDRLLEESLHHKISVMFNQDPEALSFPLLEDMNLKIGINILKIETNKTERITAGTTIEKIYDRQDIAGKLLILGEPGSGKTTTLLQLAKVLIQRAKNDINQPIPIILDLTHWDGRYKSLRDLYRLLNESLSPPHRFFNGAYSETFFDNLVKHKRAILLLDGLDEISLENKKKCLKKIANSANYYWSESISVICGDWKDYEQYKHQLFITNKLI